MLLDFSGKFNILHLSKRRQYGTSEKQKQIKTPDLRTNNVSLFVSFGKQIQEKKAKI